jgi:peptidoglycan hydrolase CwlO-like protein
MINYKSATYWILDKNKIQKPYMNQNIEPYLQQISELQDKVESLQKDLKQSQNQSQLHLQSINLLKTQIESKNH